jgi:hypothetical protein
MQTIDNTLEFTPIPDIGISDSFVSTILKLDNGKNGHGERRLYTGNDNPINIRLCQKPWKISYPPNYIEDILFDMSSMSFAKSCDNRETIISDAVITCSDAVIHVVPQNGLKDGARCYIGPNKTHKENVRLYDTLRKTLLPKKYSFHLVETDTYFICNVVIQHKKSVRTAASKVSIEYLNYVSNTCCIEIQHELNGGEFQLRNPANGYFWPVDGYHKCGLHKCIGTSDAPCQYNNYIWEFQGDYFHGNPEKYSATDLFHNNRYDVKHKKDADKKDFMKKTDIQ